jgi:hypothetical protein
MRENPRALPHQPEGGILFLDLSGVTGWAYGVPGQKKPSCGAFKFPSFDESGATFSAAYEGVFDLLEFYRPDRVLMEAPLPVAFYDSQGNIKVTKSNTSTWRCQIGLMAVTQLAGAHYGITVRQVAVSTIRAEVLRGYKWRGKQTVKDDKPVIMQWAHDHGFDPPDHNAADALAGLEYSYRLYTGGGFIGDLATRV